MCVLVGGAGPKKHRMPLGRGGEVVWRFHGTGLQAQGTPDWYCIFLSN
jgi:hypothetical protein